MATNPEHTLTQNLLRVGYLVSAPRTAKSVVMVLPLAKFSVMGTLLPGDNLAVGDMHIR
jgi:hypothetical protein